MKATQSKPASRRSILGQVAKAELVPLTKMYVDFIARVNALPDWLLRFNLGWATVGLLALVLSPLAAAALAWNK
jgi:hypothetical protein